MHERLTTVIDSWEALIQRELDFDRTKQQWAFRGQPSPSYRLKSTLERACEDFGVKGEDIRLIENDLIVDFKRRAHLYSTSSVPDWDDTIEWLALMRHYGAPARILDFTYSFFIATYFAVELEKSEPVAWAVNRTWLGNHMQEVFASLPDGKHVSEAWGNRKGWVFDKLFLKREPPVDMVASVNPFRMNERLTIQQGVFHCCSDVTVPFPEAIERMPGSQHNVIMVPIHPGARPEILMRLYRVGITRATLFPGLQGYAESLRPRIVEVLNRLEASRSGARPGPNVIV